MEAQPPPPGLSLACIGGQCVYILIIGLWGGGIEVVSGELYIL